MFISSICSGFYEIKDSLLVCSGYLSISLVLLSYFVFFFFFHFSITIHNLFISNFKFAFSICNVKCFINVFYYIDFTYNFEGEKKRSVRYNRYKIHICFFYIPLHKVIIFLIYNLFTNTYTPSYKKKTLICKQLSLKILICCSTAQEGILKNQQNVHFVFQVVKDKLFVKIFFFSSKKIILHILDASYPKDVESADDYGLVVEQNVVLHFSPHCFYIACKYKSTC